MNNTKANRRTMAHHHMRRSAFFRRPGGLITEITWIVGNLEVICEWRNRQTKQGRECSITEYASADAYLSDGKEYDLVFLDIEMSGSGIGLDGMGLARHIRGMEAQKQPIIIFVTGYEKYVYDAFDVGAFQYLVKPVDEQKFAEVFGRAAGQVLSEAEQRKKKLVIQYGGEGKAIPLNDIYYMESRNHNIVLYLKSGNIEYYAKIGLAPLPIYVCIQKILYQ